MQGGCGQHWSRQVSPVLFGAVRSEISEAFELLPPLAMVMGRRPCVSTTLVANVPTPFALSWDMAGHVRKQRHPFLVVGSHIASVGGPCPSGEGHNLRQASAREGGRWLEHRAPGGDSGQY
jgi:hypothetical protein